MGSLGLPELIIIGVIALLVFGPKKLPELGAGLGKAIKDFKHAMNDAETAPTAKPEPPVPPKTEAEAKAEDQDKKQLL